MMLINTNKYIILFYSWNYTMKTFKELMEAGSSKKPAFGHNDGSSFAVNVKSVSSNDFLSRSFGQQLSDAKIVGDWKKTAKKAYVGAKGKSTLTAVKNWVKEKNPSEFYARWKSDSQSFKDDSVEIFYKG